MKVNKRNMIAGDRGPRKQPRRAGPFAYPYPHGGYDARAYDYPLPYTSAEIGRFGRFDYVRLSELSRFSSDRSARVQRQQAGEQRAASGATRDRPR